MRFCYINKEKGKSKFLTKSTLKEGFGPKKGGEELKINKDHCLISVKEWSDKNWCFDSPLKLKQGTKIQTKHRNLKGKERRSKQNIKV